MTTLSLFENKKRASQKISMLTCYDYITAQILNDSSVDALLVGDSVAMVLHGHATTLNVSTEVMALHTRAVVRGAPKKFIVADMPFLSYRKSLTANMNAVEKLMKAGAHALKLEGAAGNLELVEHIVQSGVPVMGHLGLTPQSIHQMGGFKVQAREENAQKLLIEHAQQLQDVGCFSVVLECVPAKLAMTISHNLSIPTIGIGAGAGTDGQILVLHDMLGFNDNFNPKFLKKFMDGKKMISSAIETYVAEVNSLKFPTKEQSYE